MSPHGPVSRFLRPTLTALLLFVSRPIPGLAEGLQAKGDYFPIAVWLQDPVNADKYKAIGINVFIGLWQGPTEKQLAALEKAGITVACDQNPVALQPRWDNTVVGWLQNDEPDNAQELPSHKGYGPPVSTDVVVARYHALAAADKLHRPIMLNLGQGVAWDGYYGRGTRTNKPEDYPLYAAGADIVSFDIYPANHDSPQMAQNLSFVGKGVKRLVTWVNGKKPVWACIETTHINSKEGKKPAPEQIRSEVWMAIIHGARGITYFCHQFTPREIEAGPLADPTLSASLKSINAEVLSLATVLNDGTPVPAATVDAKTISMIARHYGETTYIFAVGMDKGPIKATFALPNIKKNLSAEVLGESRTIDTTDGRWSDTFTGYQAHLYRLPDPK